MTSITRRWSLTPAHSPLAAPSFPPAASGPPAISAASRFLTALLVRKRTSSWLLSILLFLLPDAIHAGTISGVLLDQLSGYPLSRSLVRLEPLPGSPLTLRPLQTRSGRSGQFVFAAVPPGQYRLTAQRTGYFAIGYAQRRPTGQARPITVTTNSTTFAELRAHRLGAISGIVLDENSIGIPGTPVLAYPARLPLRVASRAIADDRGIYRISGLAPGKYWVRTGAHRLEDDSGLLPTFSPQASQSRDANVYPIRLGVETTDATIRPDPGNLFSLTVPVQCAGPPVNVTLTSESLLQSATIPCPGQHKFENLPPGPYQILAENPTGTQTALELLVLNHDTLRALQLADLPRLRIEPNKVPLLARRNNLYDLTPFRPVVPPLLPGLWEFVATTPHPRYATFIRLDRSRESHNLFLDPRSSNYLLVTLSEQAGQVQGIVKDSPGIPVFLWPVSEANRQILGGPRDLIADTEGRFSFLGLPPGDYRLLATFDQTTMDFETLEEARAGVIPVSASQTTNVELTNWLAP